jgi:hypothetical protein
MALKKSELYSSLRQSCDEPRGGLDASVPYAAIVAPDGASCMKIEIINRRGLG